MFWAYYYYMPQLPFTVGIELEFADPSSRPYTVPMWNKKCDNGMLEYSSNVIDTEESLTEHLARIQACDALYHFSIGETRGLHVHVGVKQVKDLGAKWRLLRALVHLEHYFYARANPHADRSKFCSKWTEDEVKVIKSRHHGLKSICTFGRENSNRYKWCNVYSFQKYGTVEFRCFNSTKDTNKILEITCVLLCVFEATIKGKLKLDWDNPAMTKDECDAAFEAVFSHCADSNVKSVATKSVKSGESWA